MRLPIFGGNEEDRQAKAIAKEVSRAMAPIAKEIEQVVKQAKRTSGQDPEILRIQALTMAIGRYTQEIEKLNEEDPGSERTAALSEAFKEAIKATSEEQTSVLREMLASEKSQLKVSRDLMDEVRTDVGARLKELYSLGVITRIEQARINGDMLKIERERERRDARGRAEGRVRGRVDDRRDDGVLSKLLKALTGGGGGIFAGITAGLDKLAMGIGSIGLVSLLPKKVREFVDDFTNAFTMIRALLKDTWLGPIFKILESVPILGAILKKVPYLNAILAAFEILPKMWDEFQQRGGWAALEVGLQGLYKFFVGDLIELVAGWMDKIKGALLGEELANKLDFTAFAQTFNVAVSNVITDVTEMLKEIGKILLTGVDDGTLDKIAADLFWDVVDGIVASLRALFKYDPEEEFSAREWFADWWRETWGKVTAFFEDVKRWVTFDFNDSERVALYKAFHWIVYDGPLEALTAVGSQLKSWLKSLGVSAFVAAWNALLDLNEFTAGAIVGIKDKFVGFVGQLWETASSAVVDAVNDVIAAGLDIKDDIVQWFKDLWSVVSAAIYDATIGAATSTVKGWLPEALGGTPSVEGQNRTERSLKKINEITAQNMQGRYGGRPAVVNAPVTTQNNKNAMIQQYSMYGNKKAHSLNPNSVSSGW